MFSRLKRTGLVFTVTVAAYWSYSLAVVPWIEPNVETAGRLERQSAGAGEAQDFAHLFPSGSWELDRPKVLETDQGILLFDDYQQQADGSLRLTRCTLISFLAADRDSKQSSAGGERPVVVQASDGAVLEFDSPLNLTRGQFGQFVRGRLLGDVRIFSPVSEPSADDALHVATRNVQVEPQRIWAPGEVTFQYGPNRVLGRDLSVHLSTPAGKSGKGKAQVGKIRTLELVHVDQVDLLFDANALAMSPAVSTDKLNADRGPTPVEIKCEGPFRFDFEKLVASLEERVDVIRHSADGPSDQLNCELLEIYFRRVAADDDPKTPADTRATEPDDDQEAAPDALPADGTAMRPSRIVAVGFPAIIRAPSMNAGARGGRFEYDFETRRVALHDERQTVLFNDAYEVRAPHVQYELREDGGLGRMRAAGPGQIVGRLGREQRSFDAQWQGEVTLLPQDSAHVLSVSSGARVAVSGVGAMRANEIHVYLHESRQGPDQRVEIVADRLLALGDVHADSERLVADLHEARLWFRRPAKSIAANVQPAAATRDRSPNALHDSLLANGRDSSRPGPPSKLRLSAAVLHGQVLLSDEPTLEALNVEGNVHLVEQQPNSTSAVDIAADRLGLEDGGSNNPRITFQGQPSRVSARGLTLVGAQITILQGRNRADIQGPGSMTLSPRHLASDSQLQSGAPQPLTVRWQRAMQFDGRTARFEQGVESQGGFVNRQGETTQFIARGDELVVELNQTVDFARPRMQADLDAQHITFLGPVEVHGRTIDARSAVTSLDTLIIRDLTFDRVTGRIEGHGPGGRIVHRGPSPAMASPATPVASNTGAGARLAGNPIASAIPNGNLRRQGAGLIYLQVDFEGVMLGNAENREVEFLDRTRTIYGPITSWNQSLDVARPELLRDEDVLLTSRRLAVADMGVVAVGERSIEVEATGNAVIRGRLFTAAGERVSYVRAKDQLILEGDGRTDSALEFRRQPQAASQRLAASKILFYPRSQQFALQDFQSLNLTDLGRLTNAGAVTPP